jgi:Diacylglycerol kinase catalytic domain
MEREDRLMAALQIDNDITSKIEDASSNDATEPSPKVVVMMNTNSRGVSKRSISDAQEIFGADAVFSTSTPDDVRVVLQRAFGTSSNNSKHDILVVMGGDGTLSLILQMLCEILQALSGFPSLEDAVADLPLIAYVPMGTGNAVGSVVSCHYSAKLDPARRRTSPQHRWAGIRNRGRSARFRATLRQIRDRHPSPPKGDTIRSSEGSIVELPILEMTTTSATNGATVSALCFFAGGTCGVPS